MTKYVIIDVMLTFEQHSKRSGYHAFVLSDESRKKLLDAHPPTHPEVVTHHITHKFPAKHTDNLPEHPKSVKVIGHAKEDGLEAFAVEVDGKTHRPDGSHYHITHSLDRSKGKKPVHSNQLINKGYTKIDPIEIHTTSKFV